MAVANLRPRIIFFIGSLRSGGKERRLIELLSYLKANTQYEILVLLAKNDIHYQSFHELDIPYIILNNKNRLNVFYQIYKISKNFEPNLIHVWGRIQALYTLPTAIIKNIPVVNSQITGAPAKLPKWSLLNMIDRLNFRFSESILANSIAGIESFTPPKDKCKVIYNGINLNRFQNLPCKLEVKKKYNINTPFAVVMVASFTAYKDYNLFVKVAELVSGLRKDITFVGVGGSDTDDTEFKKYKAMAANNPNLIFPGKINDVEALVNACDIGVLYSLNGEGISNAILEYMALGKPVIATATGGTKELIVHNKNGYLIKNHITHQELAAMIINLINDPDKMNAFGNENQTKIHNEFNILEMGSAFENVYGKLLNMNRVAS